MKIYSSMVLCILIYTFGSLSAQTIIQGGSVNGSWNAAGSPYNIQGSIMIPNGQTLTINPGVTVNFQGNYKLYIQGRLLAIGTISDSISFTSTDTAIGWRGIRFDNTPMTNDTSKLFYCKVQFSKGDGFQGGGLFFENFSKAIVSNCLISKNRSANGTIGGAVNIRFSGPTIQNNHIIHNVTQNGGISTNNSAAKILNNLISGNYSEEGGGIYTSYSNSRIDRNIITNNVAGINGGGIFFGTSSDSITNNFISNNQALNGDGGGINYYVSGGAGFFINNAITNNIAINGGGIYVVGSNGILRNNTIAFNHASFGGALYFRQSSSPLFENSIVWGNTSGISGPQVYLFDEPSDPTFNYSIIQGGTQSFGLNNSFYLGTFQNNLNQDPLFVLPTTVSGLNNFSSISNWSLQSNSPCINAGKPNTSSIDHDVMGNPRLIGGIIDMGAYEFQGILSLQDLSLDNEITFYPNPSHDFINVRAMANVFLELSNVNGIVLYKNMSESGIEVIDLTKFSDGIYYLKIYTLDKLKIVKVVKN